VCCLHLIKSAPVWSIKKRGFRAFSRELLEKLPLEENMDDFAFDAQMLAEILWTGATIGEVSCPDRLF
jgi:hypothetical protein